MENVFSDFLESDLVLEGSFLQISFASAAKGYAGSLFSVFEERARLLLCPGVAPSFYVLIHFKFERTRTVWEARYWSIFTMPKSEKAEKD